MKEAFSSLRLAAMMFVLFLFSSSLFAIDLSANAPLNDGIDRTDPNFIKASLIVVGPGDELYSCSGHTCFRMECPQFKHDYCFSYESESVRDKVLTFFAGKLKMGMFSFKTAEFLKQYREDGRSVWQYQLNLPPDVKQRLWKVLDGKVSQGIDLPYDYVKRGCAQSTLQTLLEALPPYNLVPAAWPKKFEQSRREIIADTIAQYPWTRFVLHAIGGTDGDKSVRKIEKIVMPADLLAFLMGAKIQGQSVITAQGLELVHSAKANKQIWISPLGAACLLVVLSVVNFFVRGFFLDIPFFALQALIGFFMFYMVVVSKLPATGWNWLIVPFNPLPILFWKWRRHWAKYFVLVLVAWEAFMLLWPHQLTDPAYLVIVLAFVPFYFKASGFPMLLRKECK